MFPEDNTKTRETTSQYARRANSLARRAKGELGIPMSEPIDPRQLAAWLSSMREKLSRSSWRQYKSSLISFFDDMGGPEATEASDWLFSMDVSGCLKSTNKTSGTKLKKISFRDFQKITEHLRGIPGKWHKPLLDWMISGMLTGLRPREWAFAFVGSHEGEPALFVENAKKTNGRAHGPTRTLLLGGLAVEEISTLRAHVERCRRFHSLDTFHEIYEGCSHTLNYVCRKMWPRRSKHVTLYSCRHQFSANAKASGFGKDEIAAMMGHAVDDTATRHYGKKSAGEELVRVRPLPEEVERVKLKQRGYWEEPAPRERPSLPASLPREKLFQPPEKK